MYKSIIEALLGVALLFSVGCESSGISTGDPTGSHTMNSLNQLYGSTESPGSPATVPSSAVVSADVFSNADTAGLTPSVAARTDSTDASLEHLFTATPQAGSVPAHMRTPARLAVAQIGELSPPQPMIDELKKSKDIFSTVDPVPAPTTPREKENIGWYRSMAAAEHADYLLLVGGKADTLEELTPLTVLDVTIVGLFVVPSRHIAADVEAVGTVLDVQTGRSVALRTAKIKDWCMVPAAMSDSSRIHLLEQARDKVTVKLAQAVVEEGKR